ncbi:hypothetical protein GCM10023215_65500 [Pseudonocardia yuanmonensis]|uniref:RNA polymerase sigma-70 region 2 domain-containing protein n=1 Tax=Pseudonocardia yuanmonensis TaxID=1095914 RepID=A0ABP8XQX2_9PSEU
MKEATPIEVLWSRATSGDDSAWNEIIRSNANLVLQAALTTGLSRHDAEEVLQQTFTKLVTNSHQIEDPSRLRSWLVTTVRREAWDLRRRQGRELLVDAETIELASPPSDESVATAFDRRATAAEVRRIMARLASSKDETAFKVLTYLLDELEKGGSYPSQREIGEAVGISHAAVAKALARIRPQFKAAYLAVKDV